MTTKSDKAAEAFGQGFACSQAVIYAFAEDFGLRREMAARVAAGFGGGVGRTAGICGAVSGAIMVLGLRYGATCGEDRITKEKAYEHVREFMKRFQTKHGTLTCKGLMGCDISTPEGADEARRRQLHSTLCTGLVRQAAEIVESQL